MKLRWKLILNNRKLTMIILIAPLLLSIAIGNVFRDYSAIDHIPVAIIDTDETVQSRKLVERLNQLETIDVRTTSSSEASSLLNDSRIEAIFTILPGYETMILSGQMSDRIKLTFLESNLVAGALGDIVAREVIGDLVIYSAGNRAEKLLSSDLAKDAAMDKAKAFMEDNRFELKMNIITRHPDLSFDSNTSSTAASQNTIGNRFILGMTLAATAFYMIFIGASIIEERRQAAFDRLKSAGQPRMTGAFLGFFTFGLTLLCLQIICLSFILPLFEITAIPYLALTLAAFISSLSGLMLFASTWFTKSSVFQSLAAPAIFFICLSGGAFWSLELIPENLRIISQLSPVYWTMEAAIGLTFGSIPAIFPLLVLLITGPVLSIAAEHRV